MNAPPSLAAEIAALPPWLEPYICIRPDPAQPDAGRYTALVAQALPIVAHGMTQDERSIVEDLLFARLMFDAIDARPGTPADAALDTWLAAIVFRMLDWPLEQRRAWWRIESLLLIRDALARWTRHHVLHASPRSHAEDRHQIAHTARYWVELSMQAFGAGAEVGALFELDVSEGLLDCVNACGIGQVRSLRASALLARAKVAEGGHGCRK